MVEYCCPVCYVERADYEGPNGVWLPTCPNCGVGDDPVPIYSIPPRKEVRNIEAPQIGEPVIFCDPRGNDHNALVTAVWTPTCINAVLVSADEAKTDQYGRQIERPTSICHASQMQAPGYYWRRPEEPRNERREPLAV